MSRYGERVSCESRRSSPFWATKTFDKIVEIFAKVRV